MIIDFHKSFRKQAEKLPPTQKDRLKETLRKFRKNSTDPSLYNHPLTGQWKGYRSISFGSDWRAHYRMVDENTAYFVACGTHSQLYK